MSAAYSDRRKLHWYDIPCPVCGAEETNSCIVAGKEGRASHKVAELSEWWRGQKNIKLLDPNLLACREHMDLLGQLQKSGAWVDFTQGLDCRLLTVENIEAIGTIKLKEIHFAWDYMAESGAVCVVCGDMRPTGRRTDTASMPQSMC